MGRALTAVGSCEVGLQLLDLLDQQGDVLQQVLVLEQQLVDPGLGLQPRRGLCTQLIFQQVNLDKQDEEEEEEEVEGEDEREEEEEVQGGGGAGRRRSREEEE